VSETKRKQLKEIAMELTALLAKAIEKAVSKPAKGALLAVGSHEIDETLTVRVKGVLKKGEDTTYTPTADIPLKAALALVLEKAGVVGDAAANMLVEAMTEALEADADKNDALAARMKDVDKAMTRVKEAAEALPAKNRKGPVTGKIALEVIA
jgi:hypothetical protein